METRKVRAALHNHFVENNLSSFDKKEYFNKVIDLVEQRLGKGGVLGLVNCLGYRYEKFIGLKQGYGRINLGNAIYVPRKEILIVKGQEVFTKQGHILVLGLPEKSFIGKEGKINTRSIEDALKEAKDLNGISGLDHGFLKSQGAGPYLEKNPKLLEHFDFFEVHNGNAWISPFANRKAKEFYNKIKNQQDIGAICASDSHSLSEIGSSYSLLDEIDSNSEKLTDSLRKSIRGHKDWSNDKQSNSIQATLKHVLETLWWYVSNPEKY